MRQGLQQSDGMTFFRMRPERPGTRSYLHLLRLSDLVLSPTRPAEWPGHLIELAEEILWQSAHRASTGFDPGVFAGYVLYYHYADQELWQDANRVITRAVDLQPRPTQKRKRCSLPFVDLTYAAHLAVIGENPRAAGDMLGRLPKRSPFRRTSRASAVQAAILLLEGRANDAFAHADTAVKRAEKVRHVTSIDALEWQWWASLRETCADSVRTSGASRLPVPRALARAAGATTALGAAVSLVLLAHGAMAAGSPDDVASIDRWVVPLIGIGVVIGTAIWIGRQTSPRWGLLCAALWPLVFPIYVYRQSRGMTRPDTGEPVARFPTSAVVRLIVLCAIPQLLAAALSVVTVD
jgi:hypothetical protein